MLLLLNLLLTLEVCEVLLLLLLNVYVLGVRCVRLLHALLLSGLLGQVRSQRGGHVRAGRQTQQVCADGDHGNTLSMVAAMSSTVAARRGSGG